MVKKERNESNMKSGILNKNNIITSDKPLTNESLEKLVTEMCREYKEPKVYTLQIGPYIISGTNYGEVIQKCNELYKELYNIK